MEADPKAETAANKRRKKKEVHMEEDPEAETAVKQNASKKRQKKADPEKTEHTEQVSGEQTEKTTKTDKTAEDAEKDEKSDAEKTSKTGDGKGAVVPRKSRGKRVGEAVTFARRVEPKGDFAKMKWQVLRDIFVTNIKPQLTHYSAHEDLERVGL